MKGSFTMLPIFVGALLCYFHVIQSVDVQTVFSWDPFKFEDLPHKAKSLVDEHHQYYNSCSILPYGISYNRPKQCVFLSIPRTECGIPVTVAFFDRKKYKNSKSPLLRGFPTYEDNYVPGWFGVNDLPADDYKDNIYPQSSKKNKNTKKSHHFVSVPYVIRSGDCERLHFVDTGILEYPDGNIYVRPPIIWAFAVDGCSEKEFDKPPALKVAIPDDVFKDATGFAGLEIDTYGNCDEFALYLTNYKDNRIVVYDNVKKCFWYFRHKTFNPLAEKSYLTDGYKAPKDPYNLGVIGIILGNKHKDSYDVYYAPGSSCAVFETCSAVLEDKSLAPGKPNSTDFNFLGYSSPNYGARLIFDSETQVLFANYWLSDKITCWNIKKPLEEKNVAVLFSGLKYGTDILIDSERNLSFLQFSANANPVSERHYVHEYTYKFYSVPVDEIIRGTVCESKTKKG